MASLREKPFGPLGSLYSLDDGCFIHNWSSVGYDPFKTTTAFHQLTSGNLNMSPAKLVFDHNGDRQPETDSAITFRSLLHQSGGGGNDHDDP